MIQVDNLTKYYGNRVALRNVSFKVSRGEVVGFLGPNGAGKTTTMRILTAYMPPTDGTVTIGGYDVFKQSLEVRRRIGYLPESVPLYLNMSVQGYLDYVATLRKVDQRTRRVTEVLAKVNLADQADRPIGKLSKGMRQRVGLAQAIIHDPEVLILDEPTIGLDPKQIIEVRQLIRQLGREHTVILSTHILSEAEQICNRVLIINKGQIVAEDTSAGLARRLEGGERLRLETLAAPPEAGPLLQTVPGVYKVLPLSAGIFEIEYNSHIDCRPVLARTVVEKGWGLLELRTIDVSLEDIFLQVTAEHEGTL